MEYNFEAQLNNHNEEVGRQRAEAVEAALQKLEPIIEEATPKYLEARAKQGPDNSWVECYIDGAKQIGFLVHHGYEDIVYLSGKGELYWSWSGSGSETEPLVKLSRNDIDQLRSVAQTLLQRGDWEADKERQAELLASL